MRLSKRKIYFFCLLLLMIGHLNAQSDSTTTPPNIVLILADDVALMDFGAYGGEVKTPNIDRLAGKGTIFTNYHVSPMCAPSRAMLLTGFDSHLTGVPNLPLFLSPEYAAKPGYSGTLNNKVKTVATHLKNAGYQTYMTGKWHLGQSSTNLPSKRGFDRTFILNASGADNYEHKAYLPTQEKPPWFEDGQPIDLPEDFYSSKTLVNKMIEFMEENQQVENPFFAYLAFQAVHIPVQVPKEYTEKYLDVYAQGWDKIKQQRFENAKKLGLIPENSPLGEMLPSLEKWDDLSAQDKKQAAKCMAVNAGMLEAMDYHIGRYIAYLEKKGQLDNTVFIITSDNGPEASDPSLIFGMETWMNSVGYHTDYEKLGERGSFVAIGPQFASAAAGPSAYFKFYAGEGGLRVPLIVAGKNIPQGQKKAFSFITDVTPTILDIANIPTTYSEKIDFTGRSLFDVLNGASDQVYSPEEPIGMEAAKQAALFKGNHKLVYNGKPYGDGVWRMYDLSTDPGETKDLASVQPKLFQALKADYEIYKKEMGVLEMPDDYEAVKEVQNKLVRKVKKAVMPWLVGILFVFVGFFIGKRYRKNRVSI